MIQKSTDAAKQSEKISIEQIIPSPENDGVYGAIGTDDALIDLANDIKVNGIREPLQVSEDHYIVSGHRRYAAAKLAKLKEVPVIRLDIRRDDYLPRNWQKLLVKYNLQRTKNPNVRMKEALLQLDPDVAYQQLIEAREARDTDQPPAIKIVGKKKRHKISKAKQPMVDAILEIFSELKSFLPITDRRVHYELLNKSPLRHASKPDSTYKNDQRCYKDTTDLLTRMRFEGLTPFESIIDETRPEFDLHFRANAAEFVDNEVYHFLRRYRRNLLQTQHDHIEVIAEKLTVKSIVRRVTNKYCLPLTIGRGYSSTRSKYNIARRYKQSGKDRLKLLVISDFDPDGETIAHSMARDLRDEFDIENIVALKAMLRDDQIRQWNLPPSFNQAKKKSSGYEKFVEKYGTDKIYELEAVPPQLMIDELSKVIDSVIDAEAFNQQVELEKNEAARISAIKSSMVEYLEDMGFVGDMDFGLES